MRISILRKVPDELLVRNLTFTTAEFFEKQLIGKFAFPLKCFNKMMQ
jgi:hypothetical protein